MKKIIVSIHDVSPKYEKEIHTIVRELNKHIDKYNLLLTLNFENNWNIEKFPSFIKFIKKVINNNKKLVYHGHTHLINKRVLFYHVFKYFEFFKPKKDIVESFQDAKKRFGSYFGIQKLGFEPPVWYFPKKKSKMIFDYFQYYATKKGIYYKNKFIPSVPYLFAADTSALISKLIASLFFFRLIFDKSKTIRISIHPSDVTYKTLPKIMKKIDQLIKKGYKPAIYEDFIKK